MVDEREVDRFAGDGEAAGGLTVGMAGGGVAAGVVVRDDEAGAFAAGGLDQDRTQRASSSR
jgi:hypothetical protein